MNDPINAHRRHALRTLGALGFSSLVPRLSLSSAAAATTTGEYPALVCVFLFGRNRSNKIIVPFTQCAYANDAAVRGAQGPSGLALPQASLLPITALASQTN